MPRIVQKVPEADVDYVIRLLALDGYTNVTSRKNNGDGTWDITADQPALVTPSVSAKPIEQLFVSKAPWIMQRLIAKFSFTVVQVAGILGNIGHECGGFHQMQELRPIRGGLGGLGWAQWTGPRRTAFEIWCAANHLATDSDEGNYGYLEVELEGPQSKAAAATKTATTLPQAVRLFEVTFEAPDPALAREDLRDHWAVLALATYNAGQHP